METVQQLINEWRETLRGETYVSPSRAQDNLFALWGEVRDTPASTMVEQWLTLSVERELFSSAELAEFLDELEAYMQLQLSPRPASA